MFKIPDQLMGLGGLIKVQRLKNVIHKSKTCQGLWEPTDRSISLKEQDNREMKFTYYHEMFHAALDDSGLAHLFDALTKESLCDLVDMMMVREKEF